MKTFNEQLKDWAEQYETAQFIENDPIQIPHRYDTKVNIEISAFVTSWIAWGSRKHIIKTADFIDREIFKGAPYHYIVGTDTHGYAPEWIQYKNDKKTIYRTFTYSDFHDVCERLNQIYANNENMEAAIKNIGGSNMVKVLQNLFGEIKGIPDKNGQSACKRLCLFLRWMCRQNSPVDFGLWTICDPRNLIIPLDTHVHTQAIRLGLVTRRTPDIITALEITDKFVEVFPDDPTKGDFALFGYGVNKLSIDVVKEVTEATKKFTEAQNRAITPVSGVEKHLPRAEGEPEPEPTPEPEPIPEEPTDKRVADLMIVDVLKMPLFYNNVSIEVKNIWESRENARKALKANERLKAHPIDRVHDAGLLEPGAFVVEYAKILDRINTGLPRAMRDVIETLGNTVFNKIMQKLIDDEEKRDNSDGDNKQ